jgi:hypothetical protein
MDTILLASVDFLQPLSFPLWADSDNSAWSSSPFPLLPTIARIYTPSRSLSNYLLVCPSAFPASCGLSSALSSTAPLPSQVTATSSLFLRTSCCSLPTGCLSMRVSENSIPFQNLSTLLTNNRHFRLRACLLQAWHDRL